MGNEKSEKGVITRRDFLRGGSLLTLGSLLGLSLPGMSPGESGDRSPVVLIRDERVIDSKGRLQGEILQGMLDEAVTTLTGTPDPEAGWSKIVHTDDTVGIKSNAWHYLPTPALLERAVRARLIGAGVKKRNISADDRGVLNNPVFRRATALINVRPMRSHHWSGLGTLLKNYIMFVPKPQDYHDNGCETLGAIWQLPHVAGRTRLNILVMLTPLFHGIGPHHFSRRYTWNYCGLIVSIDPVAADATGARIIQAKRDAFFGTGKPISPPPRHIAAADTQFGLGNSRPERIRLIRIGWQEEILI